MAPSGQAKEEGRDMRVYYDRDADLNLIKSKKVAIRGFGSQGPPHPLNIRDAGAKDVGVASRPGASAKKAEAAGLKAISVSDASKWADVMMCVVPDELQADLYRHEIAPHLKQGAALFFAHGFNIHFRLIEPRADLDVAMVAPKGPGHTVRAEYQRGGGVPCLLAVHHDASGNAHDLGLAYASVICGWRARTIGPTVPEGRETLLFCEQSVLFAVLLRLSLARLE